MFPAETETDKAILALVDGIDHDIYRSFFDFDLSAIPNGATIVSCILTLRNYGSATCEASIQKGTQTGDPFGGDYSAFEGSYFGIISWAAGDNIFTLNDLGLAYIESKFEGTAKLCMREYDHDYLDIEPGDPEDLHAGLYWSGAADTLDRPKLKVTYVW